MSVQHRIIYSTNNIIIYWYEVNRWDSRSIYPIQLTSAGGGMGGVGGACTAKSLSIPINFDGWSRQLIFEPPSTPSPHHPHSHSRTPSHTLHSPHSTPLHPSRLHSIQYTPALHPPPAHHSHYPLPSTPVSRLSLYPSSPRTPSHSTPPG